MREMKIVEVNGSVLIVSDDEGNEHSVTVDETSLRRLRTSSTTEIPRVSPKDIQTHLRSGLSAEEVSALTGATPEQIERYEGPVQAEKDFIISSAQSVPTQHHVETDTGSITSDFGSLLSLRLSELNATSQRWATWRDENGTWILKLEFVANAIDHDARWAFDSKKRTLQPLNSDATTLSQKGDLTTGLIPKLRAVQTDAIADTVIIEQPVVPLASEADSHEEFDTHAATGSSPTADLLEALRKRRTERESTPAWLRDDVAQSKEKVSDPAAHSGDTVSLDDSLHFTEPLETRSSVTSNDSQPQGKKGRASLPSWDDIVFGTKSDEDPA
jgi:hypothetical protein